MSRCGPAIVVLARKTSKLRRARRSRCPSDIPMVQAADPRQRDHSPELPRLERASDRCVAVEPHVGSVLVVGAPGKAWVRRKRCRAETSRSSPRVKVPTGQGRAASRKRVLRGARAIAAAKRRQRACRPCAEPRNRIHRGGRRVLQRGRQHRRAAKSGEPEGLVRRLCRGERAGHVRKDGPGTWEIPSSPAAELRR